jgi:hypothetical protein
MFSMSTSPSHGVQFSTQITFSEEIGPVMSLRANSNSDKDCWVDIGGSNLAIFVSFSAFFFPVH